MGEGKCIDRRSWIWNETAAVNVHGGCQNGPDACQRNLNYEETLDSIHDGFNNECDLGDRAMVTVDMYDLR